MEGNIKELELLIKISRIVFETIHKRLQLYLGFGWAALNLSNLIESFDPHGEKEEDFHENFDFW